MAISPWTVHVAKSLVKGAAGQVAPALPLVAGEVAAQLSPAARREREMYKKNYSDMKAGRLGMTGAQKTAEYQRAMTGVQAAAQPARTQLQRESAAVGFGDSGGNTQQQAALNKQVLDSAANAAGAINQTSQAQALARQGVIEQQTRVASENTKEAMRNIGKALQSGWQPGRVKTAINDLSFLDEANADSQ